MHNSAPADSDNTVGMNKLPLDDEGAVKPLELDDDLPKNLKKAHSEDRDILMQAAIGNIDVEMIEQEREDIIAHGGRLPDPPKPEFTPEESQSIALIKPELRTDSLSLRLRASGKDEKFGNVVVNDNNFEELFKEGTITEFKEQGTIKNEEEEAQQPASPEQPVTKSRKKQLNVFEIINQPMLVRGDNHKQVRLHGQALLFLGPKNKFRILVSQLSLHPWFDPFIMLIILVSTVMMIIDNPLNDPNG